MASTNYNPNACRYSISTLEEVYVVQASTAITVSIDNGEAFASANIVLSGLGATDISVTTNDALDGRYSYTSEITFTTNGRPSINADGKYYVVTKSRDNIFYLWNYDFPCTINYTYRLASGEHYTAWTMRAVSNFPELRLNGVGESMITDCKGYDNVAIDGLLLNEYIYTAAKDNDIEYTNDGFKTVAFNKDTLTVEETFAEGELTTQLSFSISLDNYRSSWQYNLEEFKENKYVALIKYADNYLKAGFNNGLEAHYAIYATSLDSDIDRIDITLQSTNDNVNTELLEGTTLKPLTATAWTPTTLYAQCVSKNRAQYLLKEQQDAFGNGNGIYQCYQGWTQYFVKLGLRIEGEFTEYITFASSRCNDEQCKVITSLPSTLTWTVPQPQGINYTFYADTNITLSSSNSNVYFNGSTTLALTSGTTHTVRIAHTLVPTATPQTLYIYMDACNGRSTTVVTLRYPNCIAQQEKSITSTAQTVNFQSNCTIRTATTSSNAVTALTWTNGQLSVGVTANVPSVANGSVIADSRYIYIAVTFADGSAQTCTINQAAANYEWITQLTTCYSGQTCNYQRLYYGESSYNITTPTDNYRYANCVDSDGCSDYQLRWVESGYTCLGSEKYQREVQQISYDEGLTWSDTGEERTTYQLEDTADDCSTYREKWQFDTPPLSGCNGSKAYYLYRKYTSEDAGATWTATDELSFNCDGTCTPSACTSSMQDAVCEVALRAVNPVTEQTSVVYCNDSNITSGEVRTAIADMGNSINYTMPTECTAYIGVNAFSGLTGTFSFNNSITVISDGAFRNTQFSSLNIPSTTQVIGNYAFYNANIVNSDLPSSLEGLGTDALAYTVMTSPTITIPNGLRNIPLRAFNHSSFNNVDITIPTSVTAISSNAFASTTGIHSFEMLSETPPTLGNTSALQASGSTTPIYIPCGSLSAYQTAANWSAYASRFVERTCNPMAKITTSSGSTYIECDSSGQITSTTVASTAITALHFYECCETIGNGVFSGATNLTSVTFDDSSVIEIGSGAFRNCSNLTAITLPHTCNYIGSSAFSGCTSLTSVTIPIEDVVATIGTNAIPYAAVVKVPCSLVLSYRSQYGNLWTFTSIEEGCLVDTPLTFLSHSNNSRIYYNGDDYLEYSLDDGATWDEFTAGSFVDLLSGDTMQLKSYYGDWGNDGGNFSIDGDVEVLGNIMSLLDGQTPWNELDEFPDSGMYDVFSYLFANATGLTSADNLVLPAKTLTNACYYGLFSGCTSLTKGPELPATTVAPNCYNSMHIGNTSLTSTTSTLPAMVMADSSYYSMYNGCSSLATAPTMPATTLADRCYFGMYYGTALVTPPELPATTMATNCYNRMFMNCTRLTTMPQLPATTLADYCYTATFDGCTSLTTVYPLPALALRPYCYQQMYYGCTSLTTAPQMAPTYVQSGSCQAMFEGCTAMTTAMAQLPADPLADSVYKRMFKDCTSLTAAPEIYCDGMGGTGSQCLVQMFDGCTNLNYIKFMGDNSLYTGWSENWVRGVQTVSGTFIKKNGVIHPRGVNGIPQNWTVQNA